MMTTTQGEYSVIVRKVEDRRVEVSGSVRAGAFVDWNQTRYGEEPKELVHLVVASLLPEFASSDYQLVELSFTRYEPGANKIGWGALIVGDQRVSSALRTRLGKRVEGSFSFEDARILEVYRETRTQ
jgi:hypothetical protein